MPTPRSPDVDKRSEERKRAEQMYLDSKGSLKLVEIAEKLGLPDNKVRKWKSLDGWEAKLHPNNTEKSKKKTSGAFHKRQRERSTKKRSPKRKPERKGRTWESTS